MLRITPSDRDALRQLARGQSKDEVAVGLGITVLEMDTQLTRLFSALGVASQAEAIAAAERRGLLA